MKISLVVGAILLMAGLILAIIGGNQVLIANQAQSDCLKILEPFDCYFGRGSYGLPTAETYANYYSIMEIGIVFAIAGTVVAILGMRVSRKTPPAS